MIDGSGFFVIEMPNGDQAFTRGDLPGFEGQIVLPGSGFVLMPGITIPDETTSITVSVEGEVSVKIAGDPDIQVIGQFDMVDFVNPAGLQPIGNNMFVETTASGLPTFGTPSLDGLVAFVKGFRNLECECCGRAGQSDSGAACL